MKTPIKCLEIGSALLTKIKHARIQSGGDRGSGPPLKNHKNVGFFSNTGPDPIKFTNLPSQHSMLGRHQHASETPFKRRFAGGPMMAAFSGLSILSPLINKRKKNLRRQSDLLALVCDVKLCFSHFPGSGVVL